MDSKEIKARLNKKNQTKKALNVFNLLFTHLALWTLLTETEQVYLIMLSIH